MRVLVTAGPTREPIDDVRFISNRSSGAVGVSIAVAAARRGHAVTLLLGPIGPGPSLPAGVRVVRFESSRELDGLLHDHFGECDLLIMAAAVADYRPSRRAIGKLKRQVDQPLVLELEPVPDLLAGLASLRRAEQVTVAFALEQPEELEQRALEKMRRKGVAAIVANPLGTMESSEIAPVLLTAGGDHQRPGAMPKSLFGDWLMERLEGLCSPGKA